MTTPVSKDFSSSSSVFSPALAWATKIITNRSVGVLWWTGLAALMAGFRLATTSGSEGDEMFREWMVDWAVIWFCLAVVTLRLFKPIYDLVVNEQKALSESSMYRELCKLEPNMAQEYRAMAMHQQMRDEAAADAAASAQEALAPLGSLTTDRGMKVAKDLRLGTRLGSAT